MDVFTACYKNYSNYDPQKASLGTWVYTVANNRLKNYYRDRKELAQLDEPNNTATDMNAEYKDGFCVFETRKKGYYVLADVS